MRLFMAADLDDDARQAIADLQRRVAKALNADRALRWVSPAQMHLTLAFLGEIDEAAVPTLVTALAASIDVPPFEAVFQGLGVFPPRGAPRVLWLGVFSGAEQLVVVQRELARRLARCGIALDERTFRPHLTLARWRGSIRGGASAALEGLSPESRRRIAATTIDHVTLYQSRLSGAGPTYTALARATLT